ncbi:hypothetical protein Dcar01_00318 [Deinococcus carri]|uniref:PEGA domain-containing protein n=1 Tax=Deinococcus carri TaxID=1211323 RepID=A0ABP9W2M8_9DEIO
MKPLGPYVAARDLTGDRPAEAVRTLRATDRLTGMPVLLHVLPHAVPLPDLPSNPSLLLPSEGGIDGDTAYMVTELPPHALPASDPLLTARGALSGLAVLHGAGLTHGGVDAAQLWSVDGRVALAGAGLPWGGEATPERDLRDLLHTLDTLGGVPPALRDLPPGVSAHDLLARLDAPPELPQTPAPVAPPEPSQPNPSQAGEEGTVPLSIPPSTPVVLAASVPPLQHGDAAGEATPSPQAELEVGGDLTAPASVREVHEGEEATPVPAAPASTPERVTGRRVVGEPVRIRWNADGTRELVKPGREAPAPAARSRRPAWLWPLLILLVLLLGLGLWWARRSAAVSSATPAPVTATAAACCDVRFVVRGASGVPVRLSLLSAPGGVKVDPDREVGRAPGTVHLPRPGTYTLRVAAEGYTPGTVTVTVPTGLPVPVTLAP